MRRGSVVQISVRPKAISLGVWLFLVQLVTAPVRNSSGVKERPKQKFGFSFKKKLSEVKVKVM